MDQDTKAAPSRGKKAGQAVDADILLKAIVDNAIDAIITIDVTGTVLSYNQAAEGMFGYPSGEVVNRNIKMLMAEPYHSEHDGYIANYLNTGQAKAIGVIREVVGRRRDGLEFPIDLAVSELKVGKEKFFVGVLRDVSERRAKDKLIREQAQAIQELSTPVIQVWDQIIMLPLIGNMDSRRAQQLIETLLEEIVATQARVAILDLTGMPVVDTVTAQHLMKTVAASRMLGAEVILTGIRPEIAQTMVKLDISLTEVRTHGTLRSGIAAALESLGYHIVSRSGGGT